MRNLIIASILSAVLLSLGWLSVSGVALLVALVPLLYISDRIPRGKFWTCYGWVALTLGLWAALTTWWVWYATPVGPIAIVIIHMLYFGGLWMLYWWCSKRVPRWLSYVVLVSGWIACEYLYTIGDISFPWLTLGNGFANDTWAVQWYEITGYFGGSFWVLLANILIWEALRRRSLRYGLSAAAVVAVPMVVSLAMRPIEKPAETVKVTIVQPNFEPWTEKFVMPTFQMVAIMIDLIRSSGTGQQFIVLPETAIDDALWEGEFEYSQSYNTFQALLESEYPQAQFIIGASTYKQYRPGEKVSETARHNKQANYWYDTYNSALALDSTGRTEVYHKSLLVPGAEKMPLWWITKHIGMVVSDLGGVSGRLGFDADPKMFRSQQGVMTAAPVCYESIYGEYFGDFVKRGAGLMFVITNDGWWRDTPGYKQHFSFSRLRAIETRRYIARSANTGISGFIDTRGDVVASLGWDERGAITLDVPLESKLTFYTRHGDYLAEIMSYLFIISLAWVFIGIIGATRRRQS